MELEPTQIRTRLQEELDQFKRAFTEGLDEAQRALLERVSARMIASLAERRTLARGERIPEFILPSVKGPPLDIRFALREGPVVLTFYRGLWCPYCSFQLQAYQRILPQIRAYGASLVAVSPQVPDVSLATAEKWNLQYDVLSDTGNRVARRFGLVFPMETAIRQMYLQLGVSLPAHNGDESWELPFPGTYVVDSHGIVQYAWVCADYTRRAEPQEILDVLDSL
jgi:peroxiredoxin